MLISIATDTDSTPADYRWKSTFTSDACGQLRVRKDYTWDTSYYGYWSLVSERRYLYDGMLLVQERTASCTTLCLGVEAVLNLLGTHIICRMLTQNCFEAATMDLMRAVSTWREH